MAPIDPAAVISPCDIDAVPRLLSEVAAGGDALSKAGSGALTPRLELIAKARKLVHALETPRETMIQLLWADPADTMALTFGVRSGLWSTMAENGDGPQKVPDLAKQLGMEEELLQRMMRHMSASGHLDMVAPDVYKPNRFTKSLAIPVVASGYDCVPPIIYPLVLNCHSWVKGRGYVVPTGKHDTVYQTAHDTKMHWFEHVASRPDLGRHFHNHMIGYLMGRPGWHDPGFYPVRERLFDGFDKANKDAVLLVDLAGGQGHYTQQFLSQCPDAPGRVILQDLPVVLDQIQELPSRIERMPYDFFTEQPVKGARAYYTHFVLHDWPDSEAIKIGRRVRDAMTPGGYSKFLIHEHVVPPMDQNAEQTALDLLMMTGFGSKERSAKQWSELLEGQCGLKIVKIWTFVNGVESVVECIRPE